MRWLAWVLLVVGLGVPVGAQEAPPGGGLPATKAGQVLYLDSADKARILAGLGRWGKRNPGLKGGALLAEPSHGWTGLAIEALERLDPEPAAALSLSLSKELDTGVLHLILSADGRAWYFYSRSGRLLDRYCSNPGLPGEVGAEVLRSWAGRPDVLLGACRGRPLSATRNEVSLTDLNALLYFYYPEMRQKKPAAYRTPEDLMRLLVQVVGPAQIPAPFSTLSSAPGFKRL